MTLRRFATILLWGVVFWLLFIAGMWMLVETFS